MIDKSELKREYEGRLRATELVIARFLKSEKSDALEKATNFKTDLLKALDRIDAEGFGVCVGCKSSIPMDRLLARPDDRLCVSCETHKK